MEQMKRHGHGKEYDCIIGVSGGVDSSFLADQGERAGLRPLAVHVDNGWNSDKAVGNIKRILDPLHIDLFTRGAQLEGVPRTAAGVPARFHPRF